MAVPTMRDVARAAGVSTPTVSRVLSGNTRVSDEARQRVLAAVERLGYRTNERARSFRLGRTSTVSVVLPFVTHPSAVEVVRGILDGLRTSGYPVTLLDVETIADRDAHVAGLYSSQRPTGAIVGMGVSEAEDAALVDGAVPTVLTEATSRHLTSVLVDNDAAGSLAARHLLALGHRRMGFVGDTEDTAFGFTSSAQRRRAFARALDEERSGASLRSAAVPHGRVEARVAAVDLLSVVDRPTAVFCPSDTQALGVLDAARSMGLSVPGDVSVLGCDDVAMAADLGLSTIHLGLVEMGRVAAELVLAAIDDPDSEPRRVVVDVALRARATTGTLAG